MGLSQAERCTLLLAANPSVLGLALALLSSYPHLDDAISLPMPGKLPWQGKPQSQARHCSPSTTSRSCLEEGCRQGPLCLHSSQTPS